MLKSVDYTNITKFPCEGSYETYDATKCKANPTQHAQPFSEEIRLFSFLLIVYLVITNNQLSLFSAQIPVDSGTSGRLDDNKNVTVVL